MTQLAPWRRRVAAATVITGTAVAVGARSAQAAATAVSPQALPSSATLLDLATTRVLDSNFNGNVYTLPRNGGRTGPRR